MKFKTITDDPQTKYNNYQDDKKKEFQNPYSVIYSERNIEQAHIPHAPSLLDN